MVNPYTHDPVVAARLACPSCGYEHSAVVDSRMGQGGCRRRRRCLECDHRFTTYERIAENFEDYSRATEAAKALRSIIDVANAALRQLESDLPRPREVEEPRVKRAVFSNGGGWRA